MSMPPIDKTFAGTMKDWLMRLTLVERRLAINGGGGGGSTSITEGPGIDVTGTGSSGDPYVIGIDDDTLLPALPDPWTFALNGTTKVGDGLFTGTATGQATGQVRAGTLEGSAVDAARTMVEMMATLGAYEAGQKAITTIDDTLGRAAGLGAIR